MKLASQLMAMTRWRILGRRASPLRARSTSTSYGTAEYGCSRTRRTVNALGSIHGTMSLRMEDFALFASPLVINTMATPGNGGYTGIDFICMLGRTIANSG